MKYETIRAKSLLSKYHSADSWFHVNRSLNAYRGCEHGCVYCDGMSEWYHVDNFTTHIRIKENAAEVLRRELKKQGYNSRTELETETLWSFLDEDDAKRLAMTRPRRQVIGVCGGVSDGYQPAEREHEITRQVLETLLDFEMPVLVLTKSDLVLRDLDLLKEIHEKAFVNVMFTITLADSKTQRIFEPKSSTTSERFEALKRIKKEGLFGGVMATPIIPTIGDTMENMTSLAEEAKRVDAEFIQFGGMTLKPGRQKDYFLSVVASRFPEHLDSIIKLYSNNNKYGIPDWKHQPCNIMLRGYEVCKSVGIRDRSIRHRLPNEPEANNTVLGTLLDIIFYQEFLLGYHWGRIKPFKELAIKIERGLPDMRVLHKDGNLADHLLAKQELQEMVEEIVQGGTCEYLENLLSDVDQMEGTGTVTQF
ncbi:radical SAM protein [Candidatus Thorarchaeota archaeon]|nr:MAG: radical SAM protein [Candidatus Thorarchaeota archaeon]